MTHEVLGWIGKERSLIKPAMPNTESYYVPDDLLLRTRVAASGLQDHEAYRLFSQGWYASVRGAPGCSHLIRIAHATGVAQSQTRQELRRRNILQLPRYTYCYDDHHKLYAFDFDLFRYDDAAHTHVYVTPDIGTVLARHATGFFNLSHYSYTLH